MKTSDFYYDLPPELIAQTPLEKRDESRLLCLDKATGEWSHHHFYEVPDFLRAGDCLILNNSRVLPARLLGRRLPGGPIACGSSSLQDKGDKVWECLVRPGKHLREGARVSFGDGELTAEIAEVLPDGNRLVRFDYEEFSLRCSSGSARCRCRLTSRRSCRTRSATRLSTPRSTARRRLPRRDCTSRRSFWRGSLPRASASAM